MLYSVSCLQYFYNYMRTAFLNYPEWPNISFSEQGIFQIFPKVIHEKVIIELFKASVGR